MKPTCGPLPWVTITFQPRLDHVGDVLAGFFHGGNLRGDVFVLFVQN